MKNALFIIISVIISVSTSELSAGTSAGPLLTSSYSISSSYPYESYRMLAMAGTDSSSEKIVQPTGTSSLGLVHKIFGYTTAVAAAASVITGFVIPKHLAHSITTYSTAGLATLSTMTGYIAYHDVITFKGGATTQNAHVVLGTLSTAGLITSAIIGALNVKHCAPGIISGVVLYTSVIVVHF